MSYTPVSNSEMKIAITHMTDTAIRAAESQIKENVCKVLKLKAVATDLESTIEKLKNRIEGLETQTGAILDQIGASMTIGETFVVRVGKDRFVKVERVSGNVCADNPTGANVVISDVALIR